MANYLMTIKSLESGTWKPSIIFVGLNSPWYSSDTWDISQSNNWIGTGKGEFKVSGFNHDSLTFYDGEIGSKSSYMRFEFLGIKFPDDLKGSKFITGSGSYYSPFSKSTCKLEWSTRNIIPDEW